MNKIPLDISTHILSRLPTTECVVECKSVCKDWNTILVQKKLGLFFAASTTIGVVNTRFFSREQINEENYAINGTPSSEESGGNFTGLSRVLVGSCNGLIFFYVLHNFITDPIYIMNSATGEHLHLPKINPIIFPSIPANTYWTGSVVGGFGYCQFSGEYKVVRIYNYTNVQTNTLGDERGWRNNDAISYKFKESGTYAQGCLFWLDCSENKIVSLNLGNKSFQTCSSPPIEIPTDQSFRVGIMLFGVTLCVYQQNVQGNTLSFWTPLLDNNNMSSVEPSFTEWSWSKRLSIELENLASVRDVYQPIALCLCR
ncbi:F-box protein At3g07870-like [Papaver somniferum]|uniref:F-box protein At3g07870-like n=1 Tax=Papaver somniferum TaxID=3469 RepID=UPI000E701319|nr:F-box protein At3g07870-like [Papaver somniferum]